MMYYVGSVFFFRLYVYSTYYVFILYVMYLFCRIYDYSVGYVVSANLRILHPHVADMWYGKSFKVFYT